MTEERVDPAAADLAAALDASDPGGEGSEAPTPTDVQPVPAEAPVGYITLRMPRPVPYEEGFEFPQGNLNFGHATKHSPDTEANIRFHAEGPGDGYAVVREDHPLLADLMRKYPQVEVVESSTATTAYVCDVCDKEYKQKRSLAKHKLSHS